MSSLHIRGYAASVAAEPLIVEHSHLAAHEGHDSLLFVHPGGRSLHTIRRDVEFVVLS